MDFPKLRTLIDEEEDCSEEESYCIEYERHLRLEETLEDALEAARKSQKKNGNEADLKDAFSKVIYAARKFIVFFRSHYSSFYGLYPELLGSTEEMEILKPYLKTLTAPHEPNPEYERYMNWLKESPKTRNSAPVGLSRVNIDRALATMRKTLILGGIESMVDDGWHDGEKEGEAAVVLLPSP